MAHVIHVSHLIYIYAPSPHIPHMGTGASPLAPFERVPHMHTVTSYGQVLRNHHREATKPKANADTEGVFVLKFPHMPLSTTGGALTRSKFTRPCMCVCVCMSFAWLIWQASNLIPQQSRHPTCNCAAYNIPPYNIPPYNIRPRHSRHGRDTGTHPR